MRDGTTIPLTQSPQEFLAVVRRYAESYRAHDTRLLLFFALAVSAALEAVAAGYWFRGTNVFHSVTELGTFSQVWLTFTVLAGMSLALYILATSKRFHRNTVPRCPRCAASIRNLDDFLMAMTFPAAMSSPTALQCDICDHRITEICPGSFRTN